MSDILTQIKKMQSNPILYAFINFTSASYFIILLTLYVRKLQFILPVKFKILNILIINQLIISMFLMLIWIQQKLVRVIVIVFLYYFIVASNICIYQIAKLSRLQSLNPDIEIATQQYVRKIKMKCYGTPFLIAITITIVVLLMSTDCNFNAVCFALPIAAMLILLLPFVILIYLILRQLIKTFDCKYSILPLVHIVIRTLQISLSFTNNWLFAFIFQSLLYAIIYTIIIFISLRQRHDNPDFELMNNNNSSNL